MTPLIAEIEPGLVQLSMARARRVSTAVSNGRVLSLYLGEKKSTLERGEQSHGEVVRVDPRRDVSRRHGGT